MENFKHILPPLVCPARWEKLMVCTDASDEGQNAVAVTLELAQACGSQVFAVQVLQVRPEFQVAAPDLKATLGKEVRKNMAAIKAAAAKLAVPLSPLTPEGQLPHAAIVAAAEKLHPDLIIMGRCGKTALARILMGNVTARVIGHSPINVLVVPRGGAIGFQRLLVASDGSPYSERAWVLALAMAKQAKSQLIGVAVAPEEGDIVESGAIIRRMLTAASRAGVPLKTVNPQGVPADDGIIRAAIKAEVDLIILGSYGRTGLKKLLMGSVTERVIGASPCPILVVKKKD
jgi:nucleotide-binding universal stress UspA family protein